VKDWPLCLCDAGTVQPGDLVESDHVRKAYTGMTMYALESELYRWYYLSEQKRSEVTLIKIFDSDPTGPAVRKHSLQNIPSWQFGTVVGPNPQTETPHASFKHGEVPCDAQPRMSIETRALVFTYPPALGRPVEVSEY
jgi:hypothetical protein